MDTRIIRRTELQTKLRVGRSTIYGWMAAGLFPRPIKLGPKSVGWIEDEIDQWVLDRMGDRRV